MSGDIVKSTLPCYEDDFPNWGDMKQVDLGHRIVHISKIIGSSTHVAKNYFSDFSPKEIEFDLRYQRVTELVKRLHKRKGITDLGYVHLFLFVVNGDERYYVCDDGNRRVSNCRQLCVKKIYAEVTQLIDDESRKV